MNNGTGKNKISRNVSLKENLTVGKDRGPGIERSLRKRLAEIDKQLAGYRNLIGERRTLVASIKYYDRQSSSAESGAATTLEVPRKGTISQTMADLMRAGGRPLAVDDLVRGLQGAGHLRDNRNPKATVAAILYQYGYLFQRVSKGKYFVAEVEVPVNTQGIDPPSIPMWRALSALMWDSKRPLKLVEMMKRLRALGYLTRIRFPRATLAGVLHDGVEAELFKRTGRGQYTFGAKNPPPEHTLRASAGSR